MTHTPDLVRKAGMIDATNSIELEVTLADIRKAKPLDPTCCAVAQALKRQGFCQAIVMRSTTYINMGSLASPSWIRFATPNSLQRELIALDRGGRFEPGDYTINPHSPARRLGAKPWRSRGKKRRHSKHHITTNIRQS